MSTHIQTSLLRLLLAAALVLGTAPSSNAAIIDWGWAAGHSITGDSDVSTEGMLVFAVHFGANGIGDTTVNGVTFTGVGAIIGGTSNSLGAANLPFSSLSAPYQAMLSSGHVGGTTPFNFLFTMLTPGETYQFEWWSNNSSTGTMTNTVAVAGNSFPLSSNTAATVGGLGEFAVGTFVADGTQQAIYFAPPVFTGPFVTTVNAFQLRQVPEPGTGLLLTLGAGALLQRRRRG